MRATFAGQVRPQEKSQLRRHPVVELIGGGVGAHAFHGAHEHERGQIEIGTTELFAVLLEKLLHERDHERARIRQLTTKPGSGHLLQGTEELGPMAQRPDGGDDDPTELLVDGR